MTETAHVYAEDLTAGMQVAFLGPDDEYEFHEVVLVSFDDDRITAHFADQPRLRLRRGTVTRIANEENTHAD